jgi:hypothetical protein
MTTICGSPPRRRLRQSLARFLCEENRGDKLAPRGERTLDLLASFQRTLVEELLRQAVAARTRLEAVRSPIVSSGVACIRGYGMQ